MNKAIRLRRLLFFDAVYRNGGIGQAAEMIGVTQPAVSQAIKKLEEENEITLFHRGHGGCEPTHEGELLHIRVKRLFEQLEIAIHDVLKGAKSASKNVDMICRHLTDTQLRSHIAIARFGSGVSAARHLGISQVAVHHAARELEETLGLALYRRQVHNVSVNRVGLLLAQKFSYALREVEHAFNDIAYLRGQAKDKLVIGVLPQFPQRLLAQAIGRLRQHFPEVVITIYERSYTQLFNDMQFGELDAIIGALHSHLSNETMTEKLFDDPYTVVVRHGHPLMKKSTLTTKDLVNYAWVVPQADVPRRATIETMLASLPHRPPIAVETSSLSMMLSMLEESDCLSLVSRSHIRYGTSLKGLATLDVAIPEKNRVVGITTHKDLLPTPVLNAFINYLHAVVEEVVDSESTKYPC